MIPFLDTLEYATSGGDYSAASPTSVRDDGVVMNSSYNPAIVAITVTEGDYQ